MANRRSTDGDSHTQRGHEDTWGATEAAKDRWVTNNADKVRKQVEADNEKKEVGDA